MKKKNKYFVLGFRRYKTKEEFKNIIKGHNNRNRNYSHSHENIDKTKSKDNIILTNLQFENLNELLSFARQNLGEKKRQLKKGAAFGFEIVVDCTPDKNWTQDDYIRYLKDAESYFKERFKGLKIISSVIHLDEKKPHLHIDFSYFNELEGQWYQRRLKEKKLDRFKDILNDFEKKIGSKYGLNKGTGKELDKILKKKLAKAVEVVEVKTGILESEERKVLNINKTSKIISNINSSVKKIIKDKDYYQNIENEYKKLKKEHIKLENKYNKIYDEYSRLYDENSALESLNHKLKIENQNLKKQNIEIVKSYNRALEIAAHERQEKLNVKNTNKELVDKTIKNIKKQYNLSI